MTFAVITCKGNKSDKIHFKYNLSDLYLILGTRNTFLTYTLSYYCYSPLKFSRIYFLRCFDRNLEFEVKSSRKFRGNRGVVKYKSWTTSN